MHVLMIDDNPIDLLINAKVLRTISPEVEVDQVSSGNEALEKLKQLAHQQQLPHYILLDIKMPIMSGFEFLEAFRELEIQGKEGIKIIMVSSSIDPKDRAMAFSSPQVVDFLEKPLQVERVKRSEHLQF
jgi:CheY-like chemotaxis protein